ncbi:PAS domain-containing protein [Aureimonas sp. SK2]|uniref:PAS domain-containing protein n=1 Tax=Aureimonas sp. SK2 TaxID=3015992 RepID=UPI0024438C13|nr:PAS domain-containing protein [Aureimonas sp. SK2]
MDGRSISLESETVIDGGLTWTPATDSFHLDANLAVILGFSDRGLVVDGPVFRACIHPADRERLRELGKSSLISRRPVKTTYALRDRYGTYRDVRSDGFWIENESGEVIATCQRIVEIDYANEARADQVADLAIHIVKLVAGAEGQSAKAVSEQIQIHLLRLDAEGKP